MNETKLQHCRLEWEEIRCLLARALAQVPEHIHSESQYQVGGHNSTAGERFVVAEYNGACYLSQFQKVRLMLIVMVMVRWGVDM